MIVPRPSTRAGLFLSGRDGARRRDFECMGASLGLAPILGYEAFELVSGRWELATMSDPFFHIVSEFFVCGFGGELWFRAVARLRNWA
jgi:hypothetical protein